jgi:predicted ATPase
LRAAYDYRRRLAVETGLEPTPELARAERTIAGAMTARPGRVPQPSGRLLGRDSELAALHRLLADERLVTIVGAGGVGKTRLALEVAIRAEPVTALMLSPVTEAAAIPHALAAALDLRVTHGDVLPGCIALLAAGPHLLLVDNCEHLLDSVRDVIARLLDGCPQLTVLATSREPLGLTVEQRLRVAPLALTSSHDVKEVAGSPAVALFVERARKVRHDFAPGGAELAVIARVVRALDGLPLAIELAAGRLASLALSDLHDRLDRALDLLGDGRDVTLRDAIEWSYLLLPPTERRLLRHLSLFPDGFDMATAESTGRNIGIAGDAGRVLAHLVDASMVEVSLGDPSRYRMLDTIRSFALDQLAREGEAPAAMEHFLDWALDLARWVDVTVDTVEEPRVDAVLRREVGNLRAAWSVIRAQGRLHDAVRLVTGILDAAGWRDLTELWGWGLELADDPALETHPDAGAVLGIGAAAAWSRGELDRAASLAARGMQLGGGGEWRCHAALALVALSRGDFAAAVVHGKDAAASGVRPDQSLGVAALAAAYDGDLPKAGALNRELERKAASPSLEALHSYVAAEIDRLAGLTDRAEHEYRHAIAVARSCGSTFVDGIAGVGLVSLQAACGRVGEALQGYADLIDYWDRTGGWVQLWTTLRNLATLLRSRDDPSAALFLEAAAAVAPDAPPLASDGNGSMSRLLAADDVPRIRSDAEQASRARVLDIARQAIARHRLETHRAVDDPSRAR